MSRLTESDIEDFASKLFEYLGYAFYTAVENSQSAEELMQQDKLRENASDWAVKESVKTKLKVIVKRTLRQYGYPPDMQLLATRTV